MKTTDSCNTVDITNKKNTSLVAFIFSGRRSDKFVRNQCVYGAADRAAHQASALLLWLPPEPLFDQRLQPPLFVLLIAPQLLLFSELHP